MGEEERKEAAVVECGDEIAVVAADEVLFEVEDGMEEEEMEFEADREYLYFVGCQDEEERSLPLGLLLSLPLSLPLSQNVPLGLSLDLSLDLNLNQSLLALVSPTAATATAMVANRL